MARFFYSIVFFLILPLALLRLYWRGSRAPAYRLRWQERLGFYGENPPSIETDKENLWIHAVSVGEVAAAQPLVNELLKSTPNNIVITTTTPTGAERVDQLFNEAARITHLYAPYDTPGAVARFLNHIKPRLSIIMETELWPNAIHQCHSQNIPIVLANGRLSERSARGYGRLAGLSKSMLSEIDTLVVQSQSDADRFAGLGADQRRIKISGSLKFTTLTSSSSKDQWSEEEEPFNSIIDSQRPVLVAGSTRLGEEEKVLVAYRKLLEQYPNLLLLLVPRHPERFSEIFEYCKKENFQVIKRSDGCAIDADAQIIIGDSMGEMPLYYSLATVAFVGGSLVDTGCQNIIEPASLGKAIVTGPSQYNFQTICDEMLAAKAMIKVADEAALAEQISKLLLDDNSRKSMDEAALSYVKNNQQALPILMSVISDYLEK